MASLVGWLKTALAGGAPDFLGQVPADHAVVVAHDGACLVRVCAATDAWVAWASTDDMVVYLPDIDPDAENEAIAEAQALGSTAAHVHATRVRCDAESEE